MDETQSPTKKGAADGRVQRSRRSRQLIIEAMLDLINEGVLIPTAQQVATALILRYVPSLDIFQRWSSFTMNWMRRFGSIIWICSVVEIGAALLEYPLAACDRASRKCLHHLVAGYAGNACLALALANTDKCYDENQQKLRIDLDNWLPELKEVSAATREAIDAIASFDFWHRLHVSQAMSKSASVEIITDLIKNLLDDDRC